MFVAGLLAVVCWSGFSWAQTTGDTVLQTFDGTAYQREYIHVDANELFGRDGSGNLVGVPVGSLGVAWGQITGTLSNQTDLQGALNNKQPLSTMLTELAGVTPLSNEGLYFTSPTEAATFPLTAYARTLLDDGGAIEARGTLGLGTVATLNSINLASNVTGQLPLANLANGSSLSVLGRAANSAGVMASIAAASDHQVLRRNGTALAFGAVNLASSNAVTGQLGLANGGTGAALSDPGADRVLFWDDSIGAVGWFPLGTGPDGNSVFFGVDALISVTTGTKNTAIGAFALSEVTSGSENTAIGFGVGSLLTTGSQNLGIGFNAINAATTANFLVGLGYGALGGVTDGFATIGIGRFAGRLDGSDSPANPSQSIYIGTNARSGAAAASNEIVIGGTFDTVGLGSNSTLLGSAGSTLARIMGDLEVLRTTAAQLKVYNAYTSASNWEAAVIDWRTTANTLRLGTDVGSGGGTARPLHLITGGTARIEITASGGIIFHGLPGADPGVAGQLWNDGGTLKVSAGP